jgi:hypothetical protein
MLKTKERQAASKTGKKEVPKEQLEVAAYYHWLERGCPIGDDLTDWVEVENQNKGGNSENRA